MFFFSPLTLQIRMSVCVGVPLWTQRNVDNNSSGGVRKKKKKKLHRRLYGKRFWRLSQTASASALRHRCGVEHSGTTHTNAAQRYNKMKLVLILTRVNPAVASMRWERKRRGSAKTRLTLKESLFGSNFFECFRVLSRLFEIGAQLSVSFKDCTRFKIRAWFFLLLKKVSYMVHHNIHRSV